ncbi:MAG: HAMP domain-containing histidine kinase [Moorea sp. SIO1F2]|nr:HAMP domain-containing histidine kinase [Moorena sp. SIO1F2]
MSGVLLIRTQLPYWGRICSGHGSNVENISGTGLGLAIVKKCVDIHGGTISLNSDVSVGTTFTVMLPRRVLDADQLLKVTGKSIPDYQSGSHFLH